MRNLFVFNNVSADGYFVDAGGGMAWAQGADPEFDEFTRQNAQAGGALVFGRVTYELMASYWPTPMAAQQNPEVAEGMNQLPKYVFSRTLADAPWRNTRLLQGDLGTEVRALKNEQGPNLVVMGSGRLVAQLAELGLVDEYQLVVVPVVLGAGRTLFEGLQRRLSLRLLGSRAFPGGKVFLRYSEGEGSR